LILQVAPAAEALFEAHRPLAGHLARHYARRWRVQAADRSELEQVALIGLWEAAGRWCGDGGASFRSFAWMHIVWALLDHLRASQPGAFSALRRGGAPPKHLPLGNGALPAGPDNGQAEGSGADFELAALLAPLPERQRRVLVELVVYEIPLDVVALRMGLSRASVSRLHGLALGMLRRKHNGRGKA